MAYTVHVKPSQHSFPVEAGENILDAALRHGLMFPYGCRSGVCGACQGKLVEGKIRYPHESLDGLQKIDSVAGDILLCQAEASSDLLIEVREIERPAQVETKKLPCRVAKIEQLAPDVVRVYLKLPDTDRLQFLAGQYIDFILRDGRRRSFSLANPPHDDALMELHIRHVPGGEFTGYVFEKMKEKDLLRLEGPLGGFFLREDSDRPMILLAGGTGFAPIKAIVEHAIAAGIQRPLYFYWGARAKRDLYLHDLAQSWPARHPALRYVPVLSEPLPEDKWTGRTGFVHQAVLEDFADLSAYDVYVCGPPVMVEAARRSFSERGLELEHFYSDSFEFAPRGS
jgi:CDP-4-dehydro-6-deoxyglucose reductase